MAERNSNKRVTFSLYEPDAESVCVVGSFNNWDAEANPLKRQKDGTWKTTASLSRGAHKYRFIVDGDWRDDPDCSDREPNEYGGNNCIIRVQ